MTAPNPPTRVRPSGCLGGATVFLLVVGGIFAALSSWYYSKTSDLWRAAADGDLASVRRLVESGEPVNQRRGVHASSPLHVAAGFGHVEVANYLLNHEADVGAKDDQGLTPLHDCACYNGKGGSPRGTDAARSEIARLLLGRGANPWAKDDFARRPLDHAEASPRVAAVLREAMSRPARSATTEPVAPP